ncbi:MAG: rod shape-determining protein MreC [Lentimicrobiaceae bacterium]|nr:rod shape-determining protein MreC [Lentimicrobiaceae bacterium]
MRHILAFIWKYNFFFLFLLLEVASLILIANYSYYQAATLNRMTYAVTGNIMNTWSGITSYFHLRDENLLLAADNIRLRQQLTREQLNTDTTSVEVADTTGQVQYRYTLAKVISNSTNHRDNYIMLNKGSKQGIIRDMAVINADGVVGTVISTSDNFSWVMSVLNKHSKISGRINRLNQMGTVVWRGGSPMTGTLIDLPAHVKVKIGDTITTSGYSHIFPQDIPIGIVSHIEMEKGDHFYTIEFKFTADLNSLGMVYVIQNLYQAEQQELRKNVIDEE